ncbi:MAG TPA: MYXO-CTERM sorting domain-containing protein, partial [Polyangiaceae bacterium]|nr:MYXO-CTERM sorting domain-containing protein [Polyangiaceae bacterium]
GVGTEPGAGGVATAEGGAPSAGADASAGRGGEAGSGSNGGSAGGCSCRVVGQSRSLPELGVLAGLVLWLLPFRRRRRRRIPASARCSGHDR